MSKLEELIHKLCPNGVQHHSLGELEDLGIVQLGRGNVISKNDMVKHPGSFPVYSSSATKNGMIGTYGKYMFDDERITWSIDGGGMFFYRNNEKYSVTNVGGWLKVKSELLITRFLFHTLSSQWQTKVFNYVDKAHPSVIRNEYQIPVPPIEVQHEIVRILDNFTELTAELTAELTTRKKQYEFYRTNILSVHGERIPLTNICDICTGSSNTEDAEVDGQYNFYVRSQELLKKNSYEYDDVSIITAGDGVGVGKVFHLTNGKYALHQRAYRIHPVNSKVNCKYLFYFFITFFPPYILSIMYEGSVPSIRRPMLNNFEVLIPTLKEQQRIVDILDKFDAYCNDLSAGLPAEIAARQKQYEYYRDKLLTFKELKA